MALGNIKTGSSYGLGWLVDILSMFSNEAIRVPKDYRTQVLEVKKILATDTSGLVNTVLDFAIEAACVEYTVETEDDAFDDFLNRWLLDVNISMLGKIPTGITALAKEYFRERWKGSSHLVLMTKWEAQDGWDLPTKMWFLDGEDVVVDDPSEDGVRRIGDEKYSLRLNADGTKTKALATKDNEMFFVQKPYDAWSCTYPVPFLIRRGVYRNMKFYDLLTGKGEQIVQRAVEYMMLIKKGSEKLAQMNNLNFTYSDTDLKSITEDFARFLSDRRTSAANKTPTYTTNFDTELEQLIPEYERALKQALYTPLERRMLAGLGMVDIVEGTASTRREALLNPKPLQSEIQSGVNDFARLMVDVFRAIIARNKNRHPKKANQKVLVKTSPIKQFLSDDAKQLLRTMYDRGLLSKETSTELTCDVDFDIEIQRRKKETKDGLDEVMKAPVIQAIAPDPNTPGDSETLDDRKKGTPEADNFNQASLDKMCPRCGSDDQYILAQSDSLVCASCGCKLTDPVIFEQAPWDKNSDLPDSVKVLPSAAQTIWRKTANSVLADGGDEKKAARIAWSQVKKQFKKTPEGKWVKR